MLKRISEDVGAKALLVLPYVALAQEKVRWLRNIVQGLERPSNTSTQDEAKRRWQKRADEKAIRVVGFFGGNKVKAAWADFEIAVCTIEKASQALSPSLRSRGLFLIPSYLVGELAHKLCHRRGWHQ
jgi:DNA polymerase theta